MVFVAGLVMIFVLYVGVGRARCLNNKGEEGWRRRLNILKLVVCSFQLFILKTEFELNFEFYFAHTFSEDTEEGRRRRLNILKLVVRSF